MLRALRTYSIFNLSPAHHCRRQRSKETRERRAALDGISCCKNGISFFRSVLKRDLFLDFTLIIPNVTFVHLPIVKCRRMRRTSS